MDGMIEAEVWAVSRLEEGNSVLLRLREGDVVVPLFADDAEVKALFPPPLPPDSGRKRIYDLFVNLAGQGGFDLIRVELYDRADDLFRARLVLNGTTNSAGMPLVLEAHPVDALALALRTKCRIYVSREAAGQIGVPADLILEDLGAGGGYLG